MIQYAGDGLSYYGRGIRGKSWAYIYSPRGRRNGNGSPRPYLPGRKLEAQVETIAREVLTASEQTHNIIAVIEASITRYGIIADDLTGAMDTGVGFAKIGLQTVIIFESKLVPKATVVVINTNSRADDPETAYGKVKREAHKLAGLCVYKKIDSTLRGNIGKELRAVMDALGTEKAVVCPAFPANERTVVDGELLIENVPIDMTYFAKDPVFPVTEGHIPTLLREQGGFQVGSINLDDVKKGPSHIRRRILNSKEQVVVADAIEQVHLRYIAEALAMSPSSWLPCGCAGLAMELPSALGYRPRDTKPVEPVVSRKPVLAVVGSRHQATVRQVKMAEICLQLPLISVQPDKFVSRQGRLVKLNQLAQEVSNFINCGKSVIITSALNRYLPVLRESTARVLARVAVRVIERQDLSGVFLTGGDVAMETCRALRITGVRILEELEPGVIVGETIGGTKEGLRIITKAGGFGSDEAIVDAIYYLERNERWSRKESRY